MEQLRVDHPGPRRSPHANRPLTQRRDRNLRLEPSRRISLSRNPPRRQLYAARA
ncbi:hypothetical protein BDP81DRAFT_426106 [Colletotrichum phormii]|uniref:Uncharacterized protein n=1 Tax=Colletotrichum phormii TaxID=359342 RepID=A0AAJ0EG95_9PEZI|nr:uncharacterized protein BDP81DRAFT_426106 [Colletotrichum phormii]KAK1637883.1 hypothetical protein BDP81DRAFT_426106 [Colletotrichum phormii]